MTDHQPEAMRRLSEYAGHLEGCAATADAEEDCTCGYVDAWNAVFSRPPTPPHPTAPARGEGETCAPTGADGYCADCYHREQDRATCHRPDCQQQPTGTGEAVDGGAIDRLVAAAHDANEVIRLLRAELTTAREEAGRLGRELAEAERQRIGDSDTIRELLADNERLNDILAARDAELAGALEREQRLRAAGGQLANCAYNLAQRTTLDGDARRSLDSCRRQWDAIVESHIAARSGAGKEG